MAIFPRGGSTLSRRRVFPTLSRRWAWGSRKSLKPDLLFSGGRVPVTMAATGGQLMVMPVNAGASFLDSKRRVLRRRWDQFRRFHLGDKRRDSSGDARRTPHPRCPARPRGGSHHSDVTTAQLPLASESPDGSRCAMVRRASCWMGSSARRARITSCATRRYYAPARLRRT